jgi:diguanylate cyclase (GGDEF)-like protein
MKDHGLMKGLGLRKKFILAMLAVGLVPLLLLLAVSFVMQKRSLEQSAGATFEELADQTGQKLGLMVKGLVDSAQLLAGTHEVQEALSEIHRSGSSRQLRAATQRVSEVFEFFVNSDPQRYLTVTLTDDQGRVAATSQEIFRTPVSDEPWWKAAHAEGRGENYVGDILWDSRLNQYTLPVAVPILQEDKLSGILLVQYGVNDLFRTVTAVRVGTTDHMMLASSEAELLFCPIFQIKNHSIDRQQLGMIVKDQAGWGDTLSDVHYPNRKAINGYAPVRFDIARLGAESFGGKRWYIFTSQDPKETYQPLNLLLVWFGVAGGVGLVLVAVLAFLVGRQLVRPILQLQAHSTHLSENIQHLQYGLPSEKLPPGLTIETGDELERLAGAFNEMVRALNETSQQLASSRTQLESANQRLLEMAITDELTGLYNRRYIWEWLKQEFARAERFKNSLACLMVDLDHFKEINDRYGHPVGDQILKEFTKLLKATSREQDILGRFGGEEFIALLPQTHLEGAKIHAERLREQVSKKAIQVAGIEAVHLTVSIGVAVIPDPRIHDPQDLIRIGDDALYKAKGKRNQVSVG